jgi:hypothetical protein
VHILYAVREEGAVVLAERENIEIVNHVGDT